MSSETGWPALLAAIERGQRRACRSPPRDRRRPQWPSIVVEDAAVGLVVIDDQRGLALRAAGPRRPGSRRARASPTLKRTVKMNVLPAPGSLSSRIWPPISSTSCLEIARPKPGAAVLAGGGGVGLLERP